MVSLAGGSASKFDDVIPSRDVQDGGYALPWQSYDNSKMAAICFLHLQRYSHRMNLFFYTVEESVTNYVLSHKIPYHIGTNSAVLCMYFI